ncbi:MAG: ABC transporter ATP-binding protein [Geminicoccaceae bacterium]|nr:ABC transporter ATP-binding protein [Geminicoccaceae bacterium]
MQAAATPARPVPATSPVVELLGVTKRFPGVLAVDHVDLALLPGEVHALLGENGAGKSTLVAMLSGLVEPDAGRIRVAGEERRIASPRAALQQGISTVFQHVMLVPTLTVLENLVLGMSWWRRPDRAELEQRLAGIRSAFGIALDLDQTTGELSLGEQQQIEIVRALLRRSRVLILDEATSMLTPQGADELGALMRRLVKSGLAVVFITHKLDEACRFGDRITVLRLGRKVGELAPEGLAAMDQAAAVEEVVGLMFGDRSIAEARAPRLRKAEGSPVLSVRGLTVTGATRLARADDVSFELRPGEILGIAGIDGNGQKQLAEALAGQRTAAAGSIVLDGRDITRAGVAERRRLGLRYLTDDRIGEGAVGGFPVATNAVLKEIGAPPFWSGGPFLLGGIERPGRIAAHARELIDRYDVRTPDEATPIGRLSGGNIQKVLLARELSGDARVVVFNKPTHGLDVQNIMASRNRIAAIADAGLAVLLISTDLEELLDVADRIAVMAAGRLTGIVANDEGARARIGALMIGRAA